MGIFGINKAIELVQREIYNIEYSTTKNDLRSSASNVFIMFENVIKELFHIYSYLLYEETYEDKLSYLLKRKKIMLGDAIELSYRLNNELNKIENSEIIKEDIKRDYFIFDGKDDNYKKSKEISCIRGKIIHDDIHEFKNIEEYKNIINHGMNLCKDVLNDFREKDIFPRLFQLESITEGNGTLVISFRDEIGSILPANFISRNQDTVMNDQVYIFKGTNNNRIIPSKIKLDYLYNDEINNNYIDIYNKDENVSQEYLYLKISDRQDIIPLSKGRRLLGRHLENDIIFKYKSISRRQCMIEVTDDDIFLVDLGSTFGTYINEIKIEPFKKYNLIKKDEIKIGVKKECVIITVEGN